MIVCPALANLSAVCKSYGLFLVPSPSEVPAGPTYTTSASVFKTAFVTVSLTTIGE